MHYDTSSNAPPSAHNGSVAHVCVMPLSPQGGDGLSLSNGDADARCGHLLVNELAYVRRHSGHALARCVSIAWPLVLSRSTVGGGRGDEPSDPPSSAVVHATLRCGTFDGTLPLADVHGHGPGGVVLLSPAADRRIASLLEHSRATSSVARSPTMCAARFHDDVLEATAVVLSTPEDAVGDCLDEHWVLTHFVAPHFLDVRRALTLGEQLCLPYRGDVGSSVDEAEGKRAATYAPTRMFSVVQVEAVVGGTIRSCTAERAVTLGDHTSVRVVQACRGPMRSASAPYGSTAAGTAATVASRMYHGDALHTAPSGRSTEAPHELPASSTRQPSPSPVPPAAMPSQLPPSPSLQVCDNATQTAPPFSAASIGGLLHGRSVAATEAKEKRLQQLILEWSAIERQLAEEGDVVQSIAAAVTRSSDAKHPVEQPLDADAAESCVLDAVRAAYRATSYLREMHNDIRRFLKDPGAHPSRGNVICFERLHTAPAYCRGASGGHATGGRGGAAEPAAPSALGLQQWLRTHLGVVCVAEFRSFDGNTAWITVSEHSVQTLEATTATPSLGPSAATGVVQHGRPAPRTFRVGHHDDGVEGPPCVGRWSGQTVGTSILEALCRRREQARQQWLAAVDALRLFETYPHVLAARAQSMHRTYTDVCACLGVAAIDPKRNPDGLLDAAVRGEQGGANAGATAASSHASGAPGDAVLGTSVLGLVGAMRHAQRLVQTALGAPPTEESLDGPMSGNSGLGLRGPLALSEVLSLPGPPVALSTPPAAVGVEARRLLDRMDEAYALYRHTVAELLVGDDPNAARAALHREAEVHQERMVLLHRIERRVVAYCGVLVPLADTFLPMVVPSVALATDHRSFPELLRYLIASTRASSQPQPSVQDVEQEVSAFRLLVSRAGSMPLIPPYQLLSHSY